jgi:arylsulfatase A-like enzyme
MTCVAAAVAVRVTVQFVDASVGQLVDALKQRGLFDCTYVIITAKHGQVCHARP